MKDALQQLLTTSEAYVSAAQAHHEATLYDDDEGMIQANRAGEAAYIKLRVAQNTARELLKEAK